MIAFIFATLLVPFLRKVAAREGPGAGRALKRAVRDGQAIRKSLCDGIAEFRGQRIHASLRR